MRFATLATPFAAAALAAVAVTYYHTSVTAEALPQTQQSSEPAQLNAVVAQGPCAEVATEEQAHQLLLRLFPAAKFISAEPLSSGNSKSCLLEVEMLADASNPHTKGFVYVLPDGERFLNGPLMDKRSRVGTSPLSGDIQQALKEQQKALQSALDSPAKARKSNETTPEDALSTQLADSFPTPTRAEEVPTSEQLRERLLEKLKTLPALNTGEGQAPVYVLYDPLCPHCKSLYKQSEELAAKHGITFHWIPMFLNEGSWAMSALVLKELNGDRDNAHSLFDRMMTGQWSATEAEAAVRSLSEEDFALAKPATGVFVELARANSRIGTPLVVFESVGGGIDVISGLPKEDDWKNLATR